MCQSLICYSQSLGMHITRCWYLANYIQYFFHFRQITLKENILPPLLSPTQTSHYAHFLYILWVGCDYRYNQPAEL